MPVRREVVGSGLTEADTFIIEGELTTEEKAKAAELEATHTVEGRLAAIESACADVLRAAELPTRSGDYICNPTGQWEVAHDLRSGWTYTHSPWTIAKRRGFPPDSRVGFAARMLEDIYFLRQRRDSGSEDGALMVMFYLGVKWSASGIKERHGSKSRPVHVVRKSGRDVELAKEFLRRKTAGSRLSDSALKADIGSRQPKPLRRTAAIAAIDRGLEKLSG